MIGSMTAGTQLGQWPQRPPLAHQLIAVIRSLVQAGAPITLSKHAEERLLQRDLDMTDVLRGFRIGDIVGPVTPGDNPNEWECRVVTPVSRYPEIKREIGIVTVVIDASSLLIGTVRWEDET